MTILDELLREDESEENNRITRVGTLHRFLKSKLEDTRVSGDAKGVLMHQLEQLSLILLKKSKQNATAAGRKTIFPEDFEAAYEELLRPHGYIEKVIDTLERQTEELKALREKSALSHMEADL